MGEREILQTGGCDIAYSKGGHFVQTGVRRESPAGERTLQQLRAGVVYGFELGKELRVASHVIIAWPILDCGCYPAESAHCKHFGKVLQLSTK